MHDFAAARGFEVIKAAGVKIACAFGMVGIYCVKPVQMLLLHIPQHLESFRADTVAAFSRCVGVKSFHFFLYFDGCAHKFKKSGTVGFHYAFLSPGVKNTIFILWRFSYKNDSRSCRASVHPERPNENSTPREVWSCDTAGAGKNPFRTETA